MNFVDLNKLQIVNTEEYKVKYNHVLIDLTTSAIKLKNYFIDLWKDIITEDSIDNPVGYKLDIDTHNSIDEQDFISLINLATFTFFQVLVQVRGRKREHRLDVPASLSKLHISASTLKRAVNYQTLNNIFNLEIQCKGYTYSMVDQEN